MKNVKTIQLFRQGVGHVVAYAYDEIDDSTGAIRTHNAKDSFYVVDAEMEEKISSLETLVSSKINEG